MTTLHKITAPLDHDAIDALLEAEGAAALARDYRTESLSPLIARCDPRSNARHRTERIVNRLCPLPPLGWQSSLYPELNLTPTAERLAAITAATKRRAELFASIKPRIADKIRARAGLLPDEKLNTIRKGHKVFARVGG